MTFQGRKENQSITHGITPYISMEFSYEEKSEHILQFLNLVRNACVVLNVYVNSYFLKTNISHIICYAFIIIDIIISSM